MKNDFFKFPSTAHLAVLADINIRSDKVLSETACLEFLRHTLVVEEKIDGANLGISFDTEGNYLLQNRGAYLQIPASGQWKKLEQWLNPKIDILFEILADRYILFGEWCYAQHSVFYNCLPDWFLGFDLYDKQTRKFLSTVHRNKKFSKMQISPVPFIAKEQFVFSELLTLLSQSKVSDQLAEGIYLRLDQGDWLLQRAKLVRPSFIQSVGEHWSRSAIKVNQLNSTACDESSG